MKEIEQLKKNLEDIAYAKNITIADIEDGCGFRHGYIARMGNNQKGSISLETVIKLSQFMQTSIDSLLNNDYSFLRKKRDIIDKKEAIARLQAEIEQLESEEE